MPRLIAIVLAFAVATPLCSASLSSEQVREIYDQWATEESRTLEGWKVLNEYPTLVADIAVLAGFKNGKSVQKKGPPAEFGDAHARTLLGIAYLHGVGGAPRDWRIAASLLYDSRAVSEDYCRIQATYALAWDESGHFSMSESTGWEMASPIWRDVVGSEDDKLYPAKAFISGFTLIRYGSMEGDSSQGLERLEIAARNGCLAANVVLAQLLYNHRDVIRDVNKAVRLLKEAADQSFLPAWLEQGRLYSPFHGPRSSLPQCRDALTRASQAGSLYAAQTLRGLPGKLLQEQDVDTLFAEYIRAWPAPDLSRWAAAPHGTSRGVATNPVLSRYPEIYRWLRERADPIPGPNVDSLRVAKARCMLGECLLNGIGGAERNIEEALSLLKASHSENLAAGSMLYAESIFAIENIAGEVERKLNAEAFSILSEVIRSGFSPAKRLQALASISPRAYVMDEVFVRWSKLEEPREALEALALQGDPIALRWICSDREYQSGDSRHYAQWLLLGVKAEVPEAMLEYAYRVDAGAIENASNLDVEFLMRVCRGYAATHDSAELFLQRRRAQPEIARAAELALELEETLNSTGDYVGFLEANPAIAGIAQRICDVDAGAVELYALVLFLGHGITSSPQVAYRMLLAEEESPLATYLLGRILESGNASGWSGEAGRSSQMKSAVLCYAAAADAGAAYASYRLGLVRANGLSGEVDTERAFENFKMAADGGCIPAMLEAAKAYHAGTGVEADTEKARSWAKKAADAGNDEAARLLEDWK